MKRLLLQWMRIPEWTRVGILFGLTLMTTTVMGSLYSGYDPFAGFDGLSAGLFFSLPLMFILVSHELGHYLMCRHHGVSATPPYFLPFILFPGTLGAFIRIRDRIPDRRILMEVGAGGPLAGLIATFPIFIVGMATSPVVSLDPTMEGVIFLGEPFISKIVEFFIFGTLAESHDISFNAVAMAGWFGFLVTFLNLLPVGQLDGGHVIYSLFPHRHYSIARAARLLIIALVILWPGWLIWSVLLTRVIGMHHPPTVHDSIPPGKRERIIGCITIFVFVLILMPEPIRIPEWNFILLDVYLAIKTFFLQALAGM